jgi:hypothetical protein
MSARTIERFKPIYILHLDLNISLKIRHMAQPPESVEQLHPQCFEDREQLLESLFLVSNCDVGLFRRHCDLSLKVGHSTGLALLHPIISMSRELGPGCAPVRSDSIAVRKACGTAL